MSKSSEILLHLLTLMLSYEMKYSKSMAVGTRILNMESLPSWAKAKIKQLRSSKQKGTLVKFQPSTKRAERMLRDYEARKKRTVS